MPFDINVCYGLDDYDVHCLHDGLDDKDFLDVDGVHDAIEDCDAHKVFVPREPLERYQVLRRLLLYNLPGPPKPVCGNWIHNADEVGGK